jgi:hypothetical protein
VNGSKTRGQGQVKKRLLPRFRLEWPGKAAAFNFGETDLTANSNEQRSRESAKALPGGRKRLKGLQKSAALASTRAAITYYIGQLDLSIANIEKHNGSELGEKS